jgi:DNA-binding XRE family transcriptional regulator
VKVFGWHVTVIRSAFISHFGLFYDRINNPQVSKTIFTSENAAFRDLLREIRTKKSLTQVQLSKILGMPQSFVSKYETGERRLDVIELRAVCVALGTTLSTFVKRFEAKIGQPKQGGLA